MNGDRAHLQRGSRNANGNSQRLRLVVRNTKTLECPSTVERRDTSCSLTPRLMHRPACPRYAHTDCTHGAVSVYMLTWKPRSGKKTGRTTRSFFFVCPIFLLLHGYHVSIEPTRLHTCFSFNIYADNSQHSPAFLEVVPPLRQLYRS